MLPVHGFLCLVEQTGVPGPSEKMLQRMDAEGKWDARKGREQGTGNREQGTGNREQGTGNREQGTGNRRRLFSHSLLVK
jgi:hypothetical protein